MDQFKLSALQSKYKIFPDDSTGKILHFLGRATAELGTTLDWNQTLDQLCEVITPDLADNCSVWWYDANGELIERKNTQLSPRFDDNYRNCLRAEIKHVLQMGTAHMLNSEKQNGFFLTVPMRLKNRISGLISLCNEVRPFTQVDLAIAEELAHRAATVLDHACTYGELKAAEKHLQKMRRNAEIANQTKSLFLANMSHEIRTPLTAILGFLDLILAGSDSKTSELPASLSLAPADRQDLAERVRANSAHLLRLIDQILDLSKIESGKIEMSLEYVNLNSLLKEAHDTLILQSKRKNNILKFSLTSPVPVEIRTDPTRFKQILINIIGNAIKFTENGEIDVQISYVNDLDKLRIIVKDTGIGLTKEQIQKIFNPFSQGDATHTRRFGGTGLGLALSRQFAQHMNGDLVLVDSESNQGTTFEITLQADWQKNRPMTDKIWEQIPRLQKSFAVAQAATQILNGSHILLAEDSPDNQLIINYILEKAGATVDIASDGAQALKMGLSKTYDVILMDIELPVMSGHYACRKLRAAGYQGPIIALTAHALQKEKDESIEAGCNDHLTKPIDKQLLLATVQFYLDCARSKAPVH